MIGPRLTIEHMGDDLQERLRRLGVVKGARQIRPAPKPVNEPLEQPTGQDGFLDPGGSYQAGAFRDEFEPLEKLLPGGRLVETPYGVCFVLDHVYPLSYRHGAYFLADIHDVPAEAAAIFCRDERLAELDIEAYLFLDTETTGLSGAGTFAFMVGVAFFESTPAVAGQVRPEKRVFIVRQYFLRDHADEPAMLYLLSQLLAQKRGLITFNGRSFDLPLLDNRYLLTGMDDHAGDLLDRPHVDLLPPSRRLWRTRLGSCSLNALEQNLLGLIRSSDDVPGWAIPGLYMDYLRSGDARPLLRVFYHNRLDMLSMATLGAQVLRHFARPDAGDHPLDLLSLANWQMALGMAGEAEKNLRLASTLDMPLEYYHQALHQLGVLLKRAERREEAVLLWQQIAVTSYDDVAAHVELAKHYEWQHGDLELAHQWTQRALSLADSWPAGRAQLVRDDLNHRLERLERKIANQQEDQGS